MEEGSAAAAVNSSPVEEDIPMADAGEIQPFVEEAKPAMEAPAAQGETDADIVEDIEMAKKPEIKLEDLFDGMDSDDDDFPSSSHPLGAQVPPSSLGYSLPRFPLQGTRMLTDTQGRPIPLAQTRSFCAPSTSASSPGDTCSNG
jgi:DNA primase small subunit